MNNTALTLNQAVLQHRIGPMYRKGMFSRVYRKDTNTLRIISVCPNKAYLSEYISQPHRLKPILDKVSEHVYDSPEYATSNDALRNLDRYNKDLYLKLRKVYKLYNTTDARNTFERVIQLRVDGKYLLPKGVRELLLEWFADLHNYMTEPEFEISPRNIGEHKGKLILLDVFYDRRLVEELAWD